MTSSLMALHVTPHGEGLATARMGTPERLLAGMRVAVNAQRGRTGEGLVACATDIPVVVLLVRCCGGGGEVVVVLPCRGDWGDEGR
jgi:hypothetical protein